MGTPFKIRLYRCARYAECAADPYGPFEFSRVNEPVHRHLGQPERFGHFSDTEKVHLFDIHESQGYTS